MTEAKGLRLAQSRYSEPAAPDSLPLVAGPPYEPDTAGA